MRIKCLFLLLPIIICGCSSSSGNTDAFNTSSETHNSSTKDFVMPNFNISVTDSLGALTFTANDQGRELNLNSRYTLKLQADRNDTLFEECSFKYDEQCLEIINCINKNQDPRNFVWQLKPLKVIDKTSIAIYYHETLCTSFNLAIKDLSVTASSCASASINLDSVSYIFPGEITVFKDLTTYESYLNTHNYFSYIKNNPTTETFNNYEYAMIRIANYDLGKDPELNSVYVLNNTLYYDYKSSKKYFEEPAAVVMVTNQNYYLSLIRYPSGLNVSQYSIVLSYEYTI